MIRVYSELLESFYCCLIHRRFYIKHHLNEIQRPLLLNIWLTVWHNFYFKLLLESSRVMCLCCWQPILNYSIILFWRCATNWAVIIDLNIFIYLLFSSLLPILVLFLRIRMTIDFSRNKSEINLITSDITNEIVSEVRDTIFKSDYWVKFFQGQVRTNLLLMSCLCGMRITL